MTHGNFVYLINRLLTDGIVIAHLVTRYPHNGGVRAKQIRSGMIEDVREVDVAFSKAEAIVKAKKKILYRRKLLMSQLESLDKLEARLS